MHGGKFHQVRPGSAALVSEGGIGPADHEEGCRLDLACLGGRDERGRSLAVTGVYQGRVAVRVDRALQAGAVVLDKGGYPLVLRKIRSDALPELDEPGSACPAQGEDIPASISGEVIVSTRASLGRDLGFPEYLSLRIELFQRACGDREDPIPGRITRRRSGNPHLHRRRGPTGPCRPRRTSALWPNRLFPDRGPRRRRNLPVRSRCPDGEDIAADVDGQRGNRVGADAFATVRTHSGFPAWESFKIKALSTGCGLMTAPPPKSYLALLKILPAR